MRGTATLTIYFLDQSIDELITKAVSEPSYAPEKPRTYILIQLN